MRFKSEIHFGAVVGSTPFVCFAAVTIFLIVRFGLDFNGLYGQDSHEYLRYGKALHQFLISGKDPGDYFWPVSFPLYGALLTLLLYNVNMSMQLISLGSFVGVVIYTKKILQTLFQSEDKQTSLFTFCFLFLSPLVLRGAFLIMSDMLCLFFVTGAFFYFLKFEQSDAARDLLLFVFFTFSAITTRYPSFVILAAPGCLMLLHLIKRKRIGLIFLSLGMAGVVVAPHILVKLQESTAFIRHEFFMNWSPLNFFKTSFVTQGGGAEHYRLPNVIYAFYQILHPGYFFIGILLIWFVNKNHFQSRGTKLAAVCVLAYAIFIAGIPYQNLRYVMLTFPLSIICLYPAFTSVYKVLSPRKLVAPTFLTILIAQFCIFYYGFNIFYVRNQFEKEVFNILESYPKNTLYTFDLDVSLLSYETKHDVVNLLSREISFKPNSYLLFKEDGFLNQWEHTNVGTNLNTLRLKHKLLPIKELRDGWTLYEID